MIKQTFNIILISNTVIISNIINVLLLLVLFIYCY